MTKLLLLGIWDTTPADSWHWMSNEMAQHFEKLTGFRIGYLTIRENELNRECLVQADVDRLFKYFDKLSAKKKQAFVDKLLKDFYKHSKLMEIFILELERVNFSGQNNKEIARYLKRWCKIFPLTTMQIWFAVIMDVWYVDPKKHQKLKR